MASLATILGVLLRVFLFYLESIYRCFVPNKRKNIKGKVVLITGAGRGIGKCLAFQIADLGAKVTLWDINEKDVKETAEEIMVKGGVAQAYKCDITNSHEVKDTSQRVRRDMGDVDIIINNAGIMLVKDTLSLTEKEIRKVFDVNIISHFTINNEFLPSMLERNDGHIVTIASMAGKAGTTMLTDYAASKFAAVGYTQALEDEVKRFHKRAGIRFTTVLPMIVNTNLVNDHVHRVNYSTGPEGLLEPEDVATAIVDGLLRNQREIFIPPTYGKLETIQVFIPRKAQEYLVHQLDLGFRIK